MAVEDGGAVFGERLRLLRRYSAFGRLAEGVRACLPPSLAQRVPPMPPKTLFPPRVGSAALRILDARARLSAAANAIVKGKGFERLGAIGGEVELSPLLPLVPITHHPSTITPSYTLPIPLPPTIEGPQRPLPS